MAKKLPVASNKSKKVLKPQSNEAITNGKKQVPKILQAGVIKNGKV